MTQSLQPSITLVPRKRRLSLVIWMEGGSTPSLSRRLQLRKGLIQSGRNSLLVRLDESIFFKQDPGFMFVWSFGRICLRNRSLLSLLLQLGCNISNLCHSFHLWDRGVSVPLPKNVEKQSFEQSYWNIAITARQKR